MFLEPSHHVPSAAVCSVASLLAVFPRQTQLSLGILRGFSDGRSLPHSQDHPSPSGFLEDNSQVDTGLETGRGTDAKLRKVIPTEKRDSMVFWKTTCARYRGVHAWSDSTGRG